MVINEKMPGLNRFSLDEIYRIRRIHKAGTRISDIAKIINGDRVKTRQCTTSGVRQLLKRQVKRFNSKTCRRRKLDMTTIKFIDTVTDGNREASAADIQRLLYNQ